MSEKYLNETKSLIEKFNSKISVIMLMIFGQTFASSLAFFVDFHGISSDQMFAFELLSMYRLSYDLICVVSLGIIIDNINRNLKLEYQKQFDIIAEQVEMSERKTYMSSREKQYQVKFKAYGMFNLNKASILSFISSLVTFTILFMQLNRVV
ncbi:hypothetical protein HDE_06716 [Halotydeus destructor]|nr:hypothetical protein HDE_06716 [Halotydeus destructor]